MWPCVAFAIGSFLLCSFLFHAYSAFIIIVVHCCCCRKNSQSYFYVCWLIHSEMFGHYFMYPCVAIYLFSVIFVHGCVALRHRFGRTPKEYQKVVQEPNKSKTWMRGTMKNVRVFREWHKTFNTFWHFWLTNFKSFWQTKGEQQRAEERERER